MHDMTFAGNIITLLKEKIGKKRYKSVTVNIVLGPFTHVTPETLRSAFMLLNKQDGFKNVSLNVQKNKAAIKCRKCLAATEVTGPVAKCPSCGADEFDLLCGEEFVIKSIELEGVR